MGVREHLAEAVSAVNGCTGYRVMPDTPQAGDGWPSWVSATVLTGCSLTSVWHVWVVMANADHGTVVDAEDPIIPALAAACGEVGQVDLIEPVQLAGTDPAGNLLPCVRVQVTT